MRAEYRVYPSLLDSFAYYKRSESDGALQEILDKINRVPKPKTDAQLRGIMFESALNEVLQGSVLDDPMQIHDKKVNSALIMNMADKLWGAVRQVYLSTEIKTQYGLVELYGLVDYIKADKALDCKTTGRYNFPKYMVSFQRLVYLKALRPMGIKEIVFLITDFKHIYEETYTYTKSGNESLISGCLEFIEFLERHRDMITDKKIFNIKE